MTGKDVLDSAAQVAIYAGAFYARRQGWPKPDPRVYCRRLREELASYFGAPGTLRQDAQRASACGLSDIANAMVFWDMRIIGIEVAEFCQRVQSAKN